MNKSVEQRKYNGIINRVTITEAQPQKSDVPWKMMLLEGDPWEQIIIEVTYEDK